MYSEDFPLPYEAFRGGYGGGGRRGRRGGRFPYGGYGPGHGVWSGGGRGYGAGRWALLGLLKTEGTRSGGQLLQTLQSRGYGRRPLAPAFVYGVLRQLEDEGLVRVTDGEAGRTYALTESGTAYVDRLGGPSGPWGMPSSEAPALWQAIRATSAAAHQVALGADAEAASAAVRLLDETRRKLYRLLAADTIG
jgi:DNA-binding PadR family transcriptional regulator